MNGFTDRLQYIFGCFFSNKIAREGSNRSMFYAIVGLVLSICLLLGALVGGQAISFSVHLQRDAGLTATVSALLTSELDMQVEGKTASGTTRINTYEVSNAHFQEHGYQVIVDFGGDDGEAYAQRLAHYDTLLEDDTIGNYIALFADHVRISFAEGKVSFVGYYHELDYAALVEMSDANAIATHFVRACYRPAGRLYPTMYFINLVQYLPILLALWIILGLALFAVCRIRKSVTGYFIFGSMQVVGMPILVSGLLASVFALCFSLFFAQAQAYMLTVLLFASLFVVRSIVLIVAESARKLKEIEE